MRSSIFNGEADIKINYIFNEAQPHSDTLVVSFPGAAGDIPGGEWGYLMTIKPFNVNSLFIKSNKEFASRYVGKSVRT